MKKISITELEREKRKRVRILREFDSQIPSSPSYMVRVIDAKSPEGFRFVGQGVTPSRDGKTCYITL